MTTAVPLEPDGFPDLPPISHAQAGWRDLAAGLARWPLWTRMAWEDIRQRYRRSLIGPFWSTISLLVMVAALGTLYSKILHQEARDYVPFLTLGLLFWGLMSELVREGCLCFMMYEGLIRQIKLPLAIHVYRLICRQALVLCHNILVFVPVALLFGIWPGFAGLLLVPGLILWILNATWIVLLLGMISTRFRDVPPLVTSLMQIVFFLSPILWAPVTLGTRAASVEFNPVYHFLEIVRAPLLGRLPDALSWPVCAGITLVGWGLTFPLYARFRSRITYWL